MITTINIPNAYKVRIAALTICRTKARTNGHRAAISLPKPEPMVTEQPSLSQSQHEADHQKFQRNWKDWQKPKSKYQTLILFRIDYAFSGVGWTRFKLYCWKLKKTRMPTPTNQDVPSKIKKKVIKLPPVTIFIINITTFSTYYHHSKPSTKISLF